MSWWPWRRARPALDLSVTVVAWNRARELEGLLVNVEPFAREVVVVDGGSDDDTEGLCRQSSKVRYVARPWDGHFGRMKNASFEAATGEWILHLDTDERVGPRLVDRLPWLCAGRAAFYRVPMLWLVSDDPPAYVRTPKHFPCPVPRLFRNRPEHRYLEGEGPVHPRFPEPVRRSMKKLKGVYLLHHCLAWSSREALEAKARAYAAREPGSEATNAAYYLWWRQPHEVRPVGDLA
ncbi:MAG: glycosyltransferase [Planctomycetes bacterium]|nr:glycosyltransferase [Planctomycetota bacterium]